MIEKSDKKVNRSRINFLGAINFNFRSIQFIISSSITLITILAMLFVGIALYSKFEKTAEENAVLNARQTIDQVNFSLDYYLRGMMEIADSIRNLIYYSEDIHGTNIMEQMNFIINSRKDIVSVAVFSNEGELITGAPFDKLKSRANITDQDWFKAPIREPANLFFYSPHVQNLFEGQHRWVTSLSREITINRNGQMIQGVILVDMNSISIDQLCRGASLGKKGYIYLVDSEANIVYHPLQQLINTGLKFENTEEVQKHGFGRYYETVNGENRLITVETVNYCRWRIVGVTYMDEVINTNTEIGMFVGWIIAFGIFFVVFLSLFISSKISQPIKQLENYMKIVEEGRFDINIDVKGEAEVAQLSKAFNLMMVKIRHLMEQIVHEQEAKRKSELNALQAQINPHFLYNTLDSIVWMAENRKSNEVITMVTALARLFRISISKGKNEITVQEELEHARNYLIIQKIRYKNKFKFEIEAQKEALQYKTMKLILQPIIENAIYHGIEYMVDEGLIRVSVSITDGKLLFQIRDNGLGMKPEVLEKILIIHSKSSEGSGVGVKNVHERIQLYYGRDYGLEIESVREEGTNVKIWLPAELDLKEGGNLK